MTVWDALFPYVAALLPTVAVGVLFFYIMKYIVEGDRRERLAQSKWDAERDRKKSGQPPEGNTGKHEL